MPARVAILAAVAVALLYAPSALASPFELSWTAEGALLASAGALHLGVWYTGRDLDRLSDDDIESVSSNDVNPLDRSAAGRWSPASARWSDYLRDSLLASPLLLLAGEGPRGDLLALGLLFAESYLLTVGFYRLVKNSIGRERPYLYNEDAPYDRKREADALRSFYSGHTAAAFTCAVFVSTVFGAYYPGSGWRYLVWGGLLSAAAATGYLRYRAGMHYPSDIAAGAVAGSAVGYLVPALHRRGGVGVSAAPVEDGAAIAVTMAF